MLEAMSGTPDQVQVVSSSLNFAPKDALTWSVKQHREALQDAGYDGMTYYPLNGRMAWEISHGEPAGDIITSFLQNWREQSRTKVFDMAVSDAVRAIPLGAKAVVETLKAGMA